MTTPKEFIDIGAKDDTNLDWAKLRMTNEERAKDVNWWLGIWDDTEAPFGMTDAILLDISRALHRDYMNNGPLKSLAIEVIHAHADQELEL